MKSALHIAALYRAKYKDKKVVKDSDGKDMTVYEYSDRQVSRRNNDKADRVQKLRSIRSDLVKKVKKDYKAKDLKTRLTALAVGLIDHTYERVGNDESAKEGHFGVTGWLVKHVSFSGGKATVSYVGKSGVKQTKTVSDSSAVKLLKEAVKGKKGSDPIFTCEDGDSTVCVGAEEVNAYLPKGITAKDLRGLHANEQMLDMLKAQRKGPLPSDKKKREKKLKDEFKRALEETAKAVGHEPSTLRSQYLVPALEESYMKDGTVIDKLNKAASLIAEWARLGTKSDAEKQDEDAQDHVRKEPKKKPPRYDLRDNRVHDSDSDSDPDMKNENEKDPDMSLNYKRVAHRFLAFKSPTPEGAKKLHEDYKRKNPGTSQTWEDFYEKGEGKEKKDDDEPKGDSEKGEEEESGGRKKLEQEVESLKIRLDGEKDLSKRPEIEKQIAEAEKKLEGETKKEPKAKEPGETAKAQAPKLTEEVGKVFDSTLQGGRVQLPAEVKRYLPAALAAMSPQEQGVFFDASKKWAESMASAEITGPDAIEKAERFLDENADYQIENETDPAKLAEYVAERVRAEHVLSVEKDRGSKAKKAISKSIDAIQKKLREDTKDARYRIPSDLRRALDEQMAGMTAKEVSTFSEAVLKALGGGEQKYNDSEESVEQARGDISDFYENLDDLTTPGASDDVAIENLAQSVADMLAAKRVVERYEGKGKDRKKALRKVKQALAKASGKLVSELPRDVVQKVEGALAAMDPDEVLAVQQAIGVEADKLKRVLAENPDDSSVIAAAVAAIQSKEITSQDPWQIAEQAALQILAATIIANPLNVGGQEVNNDPKSPTDLDARGMAAFEKFKALPPELREGAAKTLSEKLKTAKRGSPEAQELNRILDGLALAAWTDPESETIAKIPGRDVSKGFVELAKHLVADGQTHLLLGPVQNLYSTEGISKMTEALQSMDDESLIRATQETQPELAKALKDTIEGGDGTEYMTGDKKEILRDLMVQIAVDDMVIVDKLMREAMEAEAGPQEEYVEEEVEEEVDGKKVKKKKLVPKPPKGDVEDDILMGRDSKIPEHRDLWANEARKIGKKKKDKGFLDLLKGFLGVSLFDKKKKTAGQNSNFGSFGVSDGEFAVEMRKANLRQYLEFLEEKVGDLPNSPMILAIRRFIETGNPDFLNSEPAEGEFGTEADNLGKKSAFKFQSSPYTTTRLSAERPACAGLPVAPSRRKPMSEALKQAKLLTDHFDNLATLVQKNAGTLLIPEKIAMDFAKRCDLISDHLEKHAGQWTMDPKGNFNVGPSQPFNPAEIGEQDATPPKTEGDEPYMKKNFIQEEFDELREVQQTGGFSNAKAASKVQASIARMAARIAELEAAAE